MKEFVERKRAALEEERKSWAPFAFFADSIAKVKYEENMAQKFVLSFAEIKQLVKCPRMVSLLNVYAKQAEDRNAAKCQDLWLLSM